MELIFECFGRFVVYFRVQSNYCVWWHLFEGFEGEYFHFLIFFLFDVQQIVLLVDKIKIYAWHPIQFVSMEYDKIIL